MSESIQLENVGEAGVGINKTCNWVILEYFIMLTLPSVDPRMETVVFETF